MNGTHPRKRYVIGALVCVDAAALGSAMTGACYLRMLNLWSPAHAPTALTAYLRLGAIALPVWLFINAVTHLYSYDRLFAGLEEYAAVVRASGLGVVATVLLTFAGRDVSVSRSWIAFTWAFSIMAVGLGRFLFRRLVFSLRRRGRLISNALIVGANARSKAIALQLAADPGAGTRVIGFLDDQLPPGFRVTSDAAVLGRASELHTLLKQQSGIDEVLVVTEALPWESFQETVRGVAHAPRGVQIRLCPGLYEILTTGVRLTRKSCMTMLTVNGARICGLDAGLKAALDYGFAALLAALFLPLFGAIALFLALSGGPVIERSAAVGLHGRRFHTYQFCCRASILSRWLYLTRLDKLPQLLNVLGGHMSMVGPRLGSSGPGKRAVADLLTLKPGITGLWALMKQHDLQEELRTTAYYIRNWTIWLDIQILAWTLARFLPSGVNRIPQLWKTRVPPASGTSASASLNSGQSPCIPARETLSL